MRGSVGRGQRGAVLYTHRAKANAERRVENGESVRKWAPSSGNPNPTAMPDGETIRKPPSRGITAIRRYAMLFSAICRSKCTCTALKIKERAKRAVNRQGDSAGLNRRVSNRPAQVTPGVSQVTENEGENVLRW